jgi:hypothetical protein
MDKYNPNTGKASQIDLILKKRMYRNRLVTLIIPIIVLLLFIAMVVFNIYKN